MVHTEKMKMKRLVRHLCASLIFLTLSASCASRQRARAPRFDAVLPVPMVIQVLDSRPALETGEDEDPEWIYWDMDPALQLLQLGDSIGFGLVRFGAARDYTLAPSTDSPDDHRWFMRVTVRRWSSRWPTRVPQGANHAQVEGWCALRVDLFRDGRRVRTLRIRENPNDFPAPLTVLTHDNVEKIVRESLAHQATHALHDALDSVLYGLTGPWPAFVHGL